MAEALKQCKNPGCKKKYAESENNDQACKYHDGKPIFHDLKKGWTCCNQIAWDWDEFEKIEGCKTGKHSDKGLDLSGQGQDSFFKSSTVDNAKKAVVKEEQNIKSIEEFNAEQDRIAQKKAEEDAKKEKKPFVTAGGKYKCTNKGCLKEYDPNDPAQCGEEACKFHPGEPVFHDTMKSWSCCNKETWDWDEFMKFPTCQVGKHNPKLV
eukprot:CAMPEP_0114588110 /NCGR_PEP_ID=MMETSP0125-20121206/10898_1 /TAXON_ID=485358 ORGANISM="Aristerostoma sp., Strain ATCC 50986" /NCGR_SAMPLE_ID=MMETSP0125 /ASSEMBLY_ACC=CAM_ASM_000245 /LENGTH=207 /DNA_ID=CAMNT_0001784349 /DNA_START=61 /DNA_END=684 /DNA_ORIENTATION=+